MERSIPPGAAPQPGVPLGAATPRWPGAVRQPTSPDFEQSAKAWLFELAPARWWHEELFHRDPAELAHMVRLRLEATVVAMQAALRSALTPRPPRGRSGGPAEQMLGVCTRERDWARAMLEQVRLVEDGLRTKCSRTPRRTGPSRPLPAPRARPATS